MILQTPNQLTFESRCVLMMSPFVWSKSENNQCLFGIQNIKVALNLYTRLQRMLGGLATLWASNDGSGVFGTALAPADITNLQILPSTNIADHILTLNFLTPYPDHGRCQKYSITHIIKLIN